MTICRWADDKASLRLTPAPPSALQHQCIPNIKEELNRCFTWICFISAISLKDLVSCYFISLIVFMKKLGPKQIKSLIHPGLHNSRWQGWHQSSAASGCKDRTILRYVICGLHHLLHLQERRLWICAGKVKRTWSFPGCHLPLLLPASAVRWHCLSYFPVNQEEIMTALPGEWNNASYTRSTVTLRNEELPWVPRGPICMPAGQVTNNPSHICPGKRGALIVVWDKHTDVQEQPCGANQELQPWDGVEARSLSL